MAQFNKDHPTYNVYRKQALIDIIKDQEMDPDLQDTVIAILGAELASVFATVAALIFQVSPWLTMVSALVVLQTPLIYFVVGQIKKEDLGESAKYISIAMFLLEIPAIYCMSGGENGTGILWLIFSFLLFSTMLPSKQTLIVLAVDVVMAVLTVVITYYYPNLVVAVDESRARLNFIVCAFVVAFIIGGIQVSQRTMAVSRFKTLKLTAKELSEKTDELTAANEEMIAMNEDLSETTKKLNATLEEERKHYETQQRFNAMLNHELRNPLNGIMGQLQLMMSDETVPKDLGIQVKESYVLAQTMLTTVNDILDFSKIQESKFEIAKTSVSFDEIIENLHAMFDTQAGKKGLELEYRVSKSGYTLYTDGVRLQQVLANLISNSIKYTQRGSVRVSAAVLNDVLSVSVEDTGIGMSDEQLQYIYEPYKRFDLEKNIGIQGTGLGMSIVKNLVEGLGGEIKVTSQVGKGSRFLVSVPVGDEAKADESTKEHVPLQPMSGVDTAGDNWDVTILCVDDEVVNLRILDGLLKKTRASVKLAKSGEEALSIIDSGKHKIDVLITDNNMPGMTGLELLNEVKRRKLSISTVVATGDASTESMREFNKAGFDAILIKPIAQKDLIRILAEVLEKK